MKREQPDERLKGIDIEAPCVCGNAPTCVGDYEGTGIATGCGGCCGHGNGEGWCVSVEEERYRRELAAARAEGYAQARTQAEKVCEAYADQFDASPDDYDAGKCAGSNECAERIRAMQPEETK